MIGVELPDTRSKKLVGIELLGKRSKILVGIKLSGIVDKDRNAKHKR